MEILVNDHRYQTTGPASQTLQALANEVCRMGEPGGQQVVVSLRCDGRDIAPGDLDSVLDIPVDRFARLELQTMSVLDQVRAALDQAIGVLDDASGLRHEVADHLAGGQHELAMQKLQRLVEVWKQVQQTTVMSAQLLSIDLEALRINERGLSDILEIIRTRLTELKLAMETQDFVLVADLLRYEFDEPLDNWLGLLTRLREYQPGTIGL